MLRTVVRAANSALDLVSNCKINWRWRRRAAYTSYNYGSGASHDHTMRTNNGKSTPRLSSDRSNQRAPCRDSLRWRSRASRRPGQRPEAAASRRYNGKPAKQASMHAEPRTSIPAPPAHACMQGPAYASLHVENRRFCTVENDQGYSLRVRTYPPVM
jgi:hypothetical protein